jgi:two-component system chemotaxis sensor kinase CheA
MNPALDITEDEIPIFLAEADEQLQILDEGLVRLEREQEDPELLQALFRAAHTLKGSSGMISHRRMVDLTHGLETALDGLRRGTLQISAELADACLEAVDALRKLCDEVYGTGAHPVQVETLVERFSRLNAQPVEGAKAKGGRKNGKTASRSAGPKAGEPSGAPAMPSGAISIRAEISPDSIASGARAFQILLALQELGEIESMEPDQAKIESGIASGIPVKEVHARLRPACLPDDIRRSLERISEVEWVLVGEPEAQAEERQVETAAGEPVGVIRIGDLLVRDGLLTESQLQAAIQQQRTAEGPTPLLGQTLVQMGLITQEVLDQVVADQKRAAQKAAQVRPASASAGEAPSAGPARARGGEKTVRTSVERLDNLMNLVGELITDRNRLNLLRSAWEDRLRGADQADALSETVTHIGRITDQLQAEVMGIRMLPVSNVFNKFPRLVRDLARKAGKQVELVIRGEDTELDRSVIEVISDPLIHLLRNAVDHGLETPEERLAAGKPERGVILLTARHEQGRIILTVEDNGRGIDISKVRAKAVDRGLLTRAEAEALSDTDVVDLIFLSGLSTARAVSDISGRGVGMDIVRNNIERLNGSIQVENWPGRGAQFQIILPLTLAIVPTLLVRVGGSPFAIPLVTVTETLRLSPTEIQSVNNRPVILNRGHVLPVARLSEVFGCSSTNGPGKKQHEYVVVVRTGKMQAGLIVDALVGEEEVVVKSLGAIIGDVLGISSAAILGDGQVALIVDVQGLFKLMALHSNRA